LDEVIVFKPLTMSDVDNIATIMLSQLEERVVEQGFTIEVDSLAKAVLTKAGYDPFYGARPLRRAIMNLLEDKLAELFLTDNLVPGNHIHVTALNDAIDIKIEKEAPLKLNLSDEDSQKLEDVKTKTRRKFVTSKDLSSIGI
jgi:ATP-dependent Clp protease ATP-binding subunit ClpB